MENPNSLVMPSSQWQRDAAKSFDKAFHAQMNKASLGMSPISMALAYAD
jgi:hypothetical protein